MSFTRTRYDQCDKSKRCNIPMGTGEYIMDINRFENNSSCQANSNNNFNFHYSDIEKKINIKNELLALNQQLGNCTNNKPTFKPKITQIIYNNYWLSDYHNIT